MHLLDLITFLVYNYSSTFRHTHTYIYIYIIQPYILLFIYGHFAWFVHQHIDKLLHFYNQYLECMKYRTGESDHIYVYMYVYIDTLIRSRPTFKIAQYPQKTKDVGPTLRRTISAVKGSCSSPPPCNSK